MDIICGMLLDHTTYNKIVIYSKLNNKDAKEERLRKTFAKLDERTLIKCRLVCKKWRLLVDSDFLKKPKFLGDLNWDSFMKQAPTLLGSFVWRRWGVHCEPFPLPENLIQLLNQQCPIKKSPLWSTHTLLFFPKASAFPKEINSMEKFLLSKRLPIGIERFTFTLQGQHATLSPFNETHHWVLIANQASELNQCYNIPLDVHIIALIMAKRLQSEKMLANFPILVMTGSSLNNNEGSVQKLLYENELCMFREISSYQMKELTLGAIYIG